MRISASEFILFCNSPRDNVERLSKIVPEVELMIDGDSHRPIGRGTIPWEDVFAAMRQLPEDVLYVMEYAAGTSLDALASGRALLEEKLG